MTKKVFRWTVRLSIAALMLVVLAFGVMLAALRYWILPDIESYRGNVAQAISNATGLTVKLTAVQSDWRGWRPRLTLSGLELFESAATPGLVFGRIAGTLSWWSLPRRELRFSMIEIEQPSVTIRRDAQGQLYVAGVHLTDAQGQQSPFSDWLLRQRRIVITGAQLTWLDEKRGAPPLTLRQVTAQLENTFSRHRFQLHATPPADLAQGLIANGELTGESFAQLADWSGTVHARTDGANLVTINQYLGLGTRLRTGSGKLDLQVNLQAQRPPQVIARVDLKNVNAVLGEDLPVLKLAQLSGEIRYRFKSEGLSVATKGLVADFGAGRKKLPTSDMALELEPAQGNRPPSGSLKADVIDMDAAVALAESLPLPNAERERLRTWQPSGVLTAVDLRWQGMEQSSRSYTLKARAEKLGWRPVGKVPGASGLSGSIDANERGGNLSIASGVSTLAFPKVLQATLKFDTLTGQATWTTRGDDITLNIQNISFANSDMAGSAFGTYRSAANGPGWIDLTGKLTRADGRNVENYVPYVVGPATRTWLGSAVEAGTSTDVALQLKGDLYQFPFAGDKDGLFLITVKFKDGQLWYADGWPRIERAAGTLTFRGERMDMHVDEAWIFGSKIARAHGYIPSLVHSDEHLHMEGEGGGPLQDTLKFIAQSPIRQRLGGALDPFAGGGNAKLALKLHLPLRRIDEGEVQGVYTFQNNTLDDGKLGFPTLSAINGQLRFSQAEIGAQKLSGQALGGPLTLSLSNDKRGVVMDARGRADLAKLQADYRHDALKSLSGNMDWQGQLRVKADQVSLSISGSGEAVGGPAQASIERTPDGALNISAKGKANVAALSRAFPNPSWQYIDSVDDWNGRVAVQGDALQVNIDAQATMFGGSADIRLSGSQDDLVASLSARTDMSVLAQRLGSPLLSRLSGSAQWLGETSLGAQAKFKLSSNLVGVSSTLPVPLAKSANEELPFSLTVTSPSATQRALAITVGNRLSAQLAATQSKDGPLRIERGEVVFSGTARMPKEAGIHIMGATHALDVGGWLELQNGVSKATEPAKPAAVSFDLRAVDLRARELYALNRVFDDVQLSARKSADGWQMTTAGPQTEGEARWHSAGSGSLVARFTNLVIPGNVVNTTAATNNPNGQPGRFPAFDLAVENFQIGKRRLGRLEVKALPADKQWRLERLRVTSAESVFDANAIWSGGIRGGGTGMSFKLVTNDVGKLLDNLNYPGAVSGGKAELSGQLSWLGAPFEFNVASLGGQFDLKAGDGQFLKVDPGVGKLLALISLQSLPRRITLDFRDIFSQGFAFDAISSTVRIAGGVMTTEDFIMQGTAARVTMKGSADAKSETQNLRVKVYPSLGGTLAVASAIAGGPAVGIGAFVLQKILKDPLDEAFAYEYDVKGKWDNPAVEKVARPAQAPRPRPR